MATKQKADSKQKDKKQNEMKKFRCMRMKANVNRKTNNEYTDAAISSSSTRSRSKANEKSTGIIIIVRKR